MYYFKYQLLDLTDDDDGGDGDDSGGEDVFLPVATTRPETILGDTAVRTNKPALSLNPPLALLISLSKTERKFFGNVRSTLSEATYPLPSNK